MKSIYPVKEIIIRILVWLGFHFFLCPSSCACFSEVITFSFITSLSMDVTVSKHQPLLPLQHDITCFIVLLCFHLISPASYYNIASGCLLRKIFVMFLLIISYIFSQNTRRFAFWSLAFSYQSHWYKETKNKHRTLNIPDTHMFCFFVVRAVIYAPKRNTLQKR